MSYTGGWRPHIESACRLDLQRLFADGALQVGREVSSRASWAGSCLEFNAKLGESSGTLTVNGTLNSKPIACTITLETLPRHYGGRIWYFRCPATGRRARKLYAWPGFTQFVHREAIRPRPTYASQRVSGCDRLGRQRLVLRRKLGCDATSYDEIVKPKWMRWPTFERYEDRDEALAARQGAYLLAFMGRAMFRNPPG